MNRLIIIGNGFDLAHQLPTKYSDFLLKYINDRLAAVDDNSISEDELSSIKFNQVHPNILKFQTLGEYFKEIEALRPTGKVQFNLKSEILRKSFRLKDIDTKWVDFEYLLMSTLKEGTNGLTDSECESFSSNLLMEWNAIKRLISRYIQGLSVEYQIKPNNAFLENFIRPIQISDFDPTIGEKLLKNPANKLRNILVLNFNYTNYINEYIDLLEQSIPLTNRSLRIKLVNIHGQASDSSSVIFGYGNNNSEIHKRIENSNSTSGLKLMKSSAYHSFSNSARCYNSSNLRNSRFTLWTFSWYF